MEFSKFLDSWDDVDKFVSAKEFSILDPGGLVKFVSNTDSPPPSVELKCLIIAVARQTCILAKSKDDRGAAQGLFKSKIKGDKSMHIGNYVSNTWLIQSVEQLKKTETIEKENMHVHILTAGFRFMQDCFVIDNTKKLDVLKEKQNIDWKGTTKNVLDVATSKNLTSLESLAKTLTTYLSDFKATSSVPIAAAAKSSRTSSVDSQALQDATRKKREERMRKLREKAHGAMSLASTPAAGTTNAAMPSAVAPPPAPPSSYSSNTTATTTTNNNRYDKAQSSQDNASRGWNAPPAPAPAVPPASAPPQSWGGPPPQEPAYQESNYNAPIDQGRDHPDPTSQPPTAAADNYNQQQPSWNDPGVPPAAAAANSYSYSGGPQSYGGGGQYDDSYRDAYPPQESRNDYDRPPEATNQQPYDNTNDYANHQGADSYYPGASSAAGHDNQSSGGGYRRGGGGYDRGPPPPQDSYGGGRPPYDRYEEPPYRGGGGRNNSNFNNKRPRQDAFADDRGRGGGPWMNDNGGGGPPPKRHDSGGGPRDIPGSGRGRGRTLPAWMMGGEGGPGGDLPPPPMSELPPPPSSHGPPRGQPPPSFDEPPRPPRGPPPQFDEPPRPPRGQPPPFDEPPNMGGGRGRGRTLPAWMTQNDGPGGP